MGLSSLRGLFEIERDVVYRLYLQALHKILSCLWGSVSDRSNYSCVVRSSVSWVHLDI